MTALVAFAPVPTLMKQIFILQSCMPVMTNAPVVANSMTPMLIMLPSWSQKPPCYQ